MEECEEFQNEKSCKTTLHTLHPSHAHHFIPVAQTGMYLLHTECLEDNTETLHVTTAEQMGMFASESGKNID